MIGNDQSICLSCYMSISLFTCLCLSFTNNNNKIRHTLYQKNLILSEKSLKTPICERQQSSYRGSFAIESGKWAVVRLPWSAFEGYGPGADSNPFVPSLRRLGVVSIGEAKDVVLAVGKVGFFSVF